MFRMENKNMLKIGIWFILLKEGIVFFFGYRRGVYI